MPGKYLEYIKFGRYAVPIEISFLQAVLTEKGTGIKTVTSKWAEHKHWKVIKTLLKPAVETCANTESFTNIKPPNIQCESDIALGYVVVLDSRKERSPFLSVLESKKNCWTDEEEEDDQFEELYSGIKDYGGSFKNLTSTKGYVKVVVMKRTDSQSEDCKRIKKEIGLKQDDLRNYFQSSSQATSTVTLSSLQDKNKRMIFNSGSDEKLRSFKSKRQGHEQMWNIGSYYEEQDDIDESDNILGYQEPDPFHENDDQSDDDNFSLPDIDAPQVDIQQKQMKKEKATKEKKKQKSESSKKRSHSESSVSIDDSSSVKKKIKIVSQGDKSSSQLKTKTVLSSSLQSEENINLGLRGQAKKLRVSALKASVDKQKDDIEDEKEIDRSKNVDKVRKTRPKKKVSYNEDISDSPELLPVHSVPDPPKRKKDKLIDDYFSPVSSKKSSNSDSKSKDVVEKKSKKRNKIVKALQMENIEEEEEESDSSVLPPKLVKCATEGKEKSIRLRGKEPEMPTLLPEVTVNKDEEEENKKEEEESRSRINKYMSNEKKKSSAAKAKSKIKLPFSVSTTRSQARTRKISQDIVPPNESTKSSSQIQTTTKSTPINNTDALMMPPPKFLPPRSPVKSKTRNSVATSTIKSEMLTKAHSSKTHVRNSLFSPGSSGSAVSNLGTYHLLINPNVLMAGVGFLNKLVTKEMTAEELNEKLSGPDDKVKKVERKRESSPDITSLPPPPKSSLKKKEGKKGSSEESPAEDEEDDFEAAEKEKGEKYFKELYKRVETNGPSSYEPEGDEFDLSQTSMYNLKLVPSYQQKSRLYKMHAKKIQDLTFEQLIDNYAAIRPTLRSIFEGELLNERGELYMRGNAGRKMLQDISVSIPFDHDQTTSLLTLLFEYFIPETSERPDWSDYINFVLLPEALINIYARVNDIPYDMAEKELQVGPCYDDEPIENENTETLENGETAEISETGEHVENTETVEHETNE